MSYAGRLCIEHIDSLQDDADFWGRWMDRLHPDERRAIAQGEIKVVKRPVAPAWTPGEWMEVASNLRWRPHAPQFTHRGWRIRFDLEDFRVRLPKHVPGMYEPPELDSFGLPIPPSPDAVKAARLDGSYTASHALAVPDTADEVGDDFLDRLTEQGRERDRVRLQGVVVAALEVRAVIRERMESPEFREMTALTVRRMDRDIEKLIKRTKRRAA